MKPKIEIYPSDYSKVLGASTDNRTFAITGDTFYSFQIGEVVNASVMVDVQLFMILTARSELNLILDEKDDFSPNQLEIPFTIQVKKEELVKYQEGAEDFNVELLEKDNQKVFNFFREKVKKLYEYKTGQFVSPYMKGKEEYLEFTEDTAPMWGGPFDQKYAGVSINNNEEDDYSSLPDLSKIVISPYEAFNWYDLPNPIWNEIDKNYFDKEMVTLHGASNIWYIADAIKNDQHDYRKKYPNFPVDMDNLREHAWNLLSPKQQMVMVSKVIQRINHDLYEGNKQLNWEVHLYGNDDCSYTKWFGSKEDAEAELQMLRNMQPLDFYDDVCNRGYIFTN